MFSCMYDRKVRDVFAAGGRYDSLIREHRHKTGSQSDERHAVGFNLAWEKLARLPKASARGFLKKPDEEIHGIWSTKRVSNSSLACVMLITRQETFVGMHFQSHSNGFVDSRHSG